MTGVSFGLRTGSYGSLQQLSNGAPQNQGAPVLLRKPSKLGVPGYREKEKFLPFVCRYLGRKRVAMMLLVALALLVFVFGSFTVNKGSPFRLPFSEEITACIFNLSMNFEFNSGVWLLLMFRDEGSVGWLLFLPLALGLLFENDGCLAFATLRGGCLWVCLRLDVLDNLFGQFSWCIPILPNQGLRSLWLPQHEP